jgi:hypothetical protein
VPDLVVLAVLVRAHREWVVQVLGQLLLPVQVPQEPVLPDPAPWPVVPALLQVPLVPAQVPPGLVVPVDPEVQVQRVVGPVAPVQRLLSRRSFSAAMARNSPSPERPR